MDELKTQEETPEVEENGGEPEEGHEEHREEPRAPADPHRESGSWLSKLIWLVILALIVWGGWTVYRRGTAQDATPEPGAAEATPATNTPEQPAQ